MAQTKFLYEVLIRGSKDGSIAGAHQVWAQSVTDDATGADLGVILQPATVLKTEDIKGLIDTNFIGLTVQLASLQAEKDELTAQLAVAQQAISDLQVPEPMSVTDRPVA